jgi:hypothetical protein
LEDPLRNRSFVAFALVLATSSSADAAIFTVGGTHPTLQAAVDAARLRAGSHEIRLTTDRVRAPVDVNLPAGVALTISGGWDKIFKVQIPGAATELFADNQHRPLTVKLDGGKLTLRRLHFVSGVEREGGGLWAFVRNGRLEVEDSLWRNNQAFEIGGGAWVQLDGGADVTFNRVAFEENLVSGSEVAGGGLAILESPGARGNRATVQSCRFERNWLLTDGFAGSAGGGLLVNLQDANLKLLDSGFSDNQRSGSGQSSVGTGLALWASGNARIEARRLWIAGQSARFARVADTQVDLRTSDRGVLALTDSAVVRSPLRGVSALASDRSSLRLINLTIAFNDAGGLVIENLEQGADDTEAFASVDNSILWQNDGAPRIGGLVARRNNLIDVDPKFVGDGFRLQLKSKARDKGSKALGVGPFDLARRPRVSGREVDIGAYEFR